MEKADIVSQQKQAILDGQSAVLDSALGAAVDLAIASVPSNPDVDAAVAAAVGPLNDQIAALNAQVASLFSADQVHQAVLDEDAKLAAKLKPILDALAESVAPADPVPAQ